MQPDYIYGQGNTPHSGTPVGKFGNGKSHGCGPFALYNTLFALGRNPDIKQIIRNIRYAGGFVLGGLFGTSPKALVNYLRALGYKTNISYLPRNIEKLTESADIFILFYIWRRRFKIGIHYVMIRYADGGYLVYNQYANDLRPRRYPYINGRFAALGVITIMN
jgi:hypothetical protein